MRPGPWLPRGFLEFSPFRAVALPPPARSVDARGQWLVAIIDATVNHSGLVPDFAPWL